MWNLKCGVRVIGGAFLAILVAIAGQAQGKSEGQDFHQSYELAAKGIISVTNPSGSIRIVSWGESRVQVDAIRRGRAEDFDQVQIEVSATPDRISIETIITRGPRNRSVNVTVDYELRVPRTAIIDSATTGSGDIVLTGPLERVNASTRSGNLVAADIDESSVLSSRSGNVTARNIRGELRAESLSGGIIAENIGSRLSAVSRSGSVRATDIREDSMVSTQSGAIRLSQIGGRTIARSMSGSVTIGNIGGDVQAETLSDSVIVTDARGHVNASSVSSNIILRNLDRGARAVSVTGNVELTAVRGRIEAATTRGTLRLAGIDSPEISARAVSGDVRFAGTLYPAGHYEFESFGGNVVLDLPSDSQFVVSARSHSGSVNTEFPLTILPGVATSPNRGELRGTVGKGGAVIRAATFSGSVYLRNHSAP